MRINILLLLVSTLVVYSCHSVMTTRYITAEDIERMDIVQPLGGATNINVRYEFPNPTNFLHEPALKRSLLINGQGDDK